MKKQADNHTAEEVKDNQENTLETSNNNGLDASKLAAEVALLKEELDKANDQKLRLAAEYDNYRRRTQAEFGAIVKLAGERIISNLLPVMDDFERLLSHKDKSINVDSLTQGAEMIFRKFASILSAEGLEHINSVGEVFDSDIHDAVGEIIDAEKADGTIVAETEKGWRLNGKIIRHPKVLVCKKESGS